MMIKAVSFDLDGTLTNRFPGNYDWFKDRSRCPAIGLM